VELDQFSAPVDSKAPSGVDLRNDARFHAIERLIAPAAKDNRTASDDDDASVASSVEWVDVREKAAELAAEGQDLRLLVIVTRSLFNTDGFAGLAAGLGMLTKVLDEYWETLHPTLRDRPSPKEAALRRTNALKQLENDESGLLGDMEYLPVFTLRGLGPVSGEDLCRGKMTADQVLREGPSGLGKAEQDALNNAHNDLIKRVTASCRAYASEHPDDMAGLRKGVNDASVSLAALEGKLSEKLGGNGTGVKFGELSQFLERVARTLGTSEESETDAQEADMTADTPPTDAPTKVGKADNAGNIPGAISTRKDVEKCLDMIISFYERTEPSSPIPHLARRMRRMVPMDFMELMQEVAPSGMKEFRSAAGVSDKAK